MVEVFNFAEASLWFLIAGVLFLKARRLNRSRAKIARVASAAFFLFGISDLIEARTGAWWMPWWLLVWKTICVVVFLVCLIQYRKFDR